MDFIGGGRDERQQTESSLLCRENFVTARCTAVCVRQCAGLMYAGGRWCCSPWISYICPAGARPKPRPSYVPTITLYSYYCGTVLCASVPSGGVQLGVGELVSALAAPSPLIAGGNTVLAIVRILTLTLLQVLVPSAGIRGFLDASDFPTWLKFVRRSSRSNLRHVLLGGQIFYQTVRKLFFFII